eukprot:g14004.t1
MSAAASQKQGESEPGSGSITIDVTSDFACPWCYVGFKRLENAMQLAKDKSGAACSFQIRWHPYMIDARTQLDGEPYLEYNRRRWGGDGWVAGMKLDCAADGCRFENWGRQNPRSVWAHTLHAHRLMHYVQREYGDAAGHALKRQLFHEYYEKGRNISLVDEVADIGKEFVKRWQEGEGEQKEWAQKIFRKSMWAAAVKAEVKVDEYMRSEKQEDGYEDVLNADKKAKKRGVSGVPYFDVKGIQRGFSGAQPTEFWSDLFEQMA